MSDSEQEPVTEINTQAEPAEPPKEAPKKRGRKPKGGAKKAQAEKKAAVSLSFYNLIIFGFELYRWNGQSNYLGHLDLNLEPYDLRLKIVSRSRDIK